jgi:hypothetical protein
MSENKKEKERQKKIIQYLRVGKWAERRRKESIRDSNTKKLPGEFGWQREREGGREREKERKKEENKHSK